MNICNPRCQALTISLATCLTLSACNWVDSTGRQSNETPTIILDDGTPDDGYMLPINEESTQIIDPSASTDADGNIVAWSWDSTPSAAGALSVCNNVDGFNSEYAADSLAEACTEPSNCSLNVSAEEVEKTEEEIQQDQAAADEAGEGTIVSTRKTLFTVITPKLKAPIGLTHRISARDNDGGSGFAEVNLCLVAINEAPEAMDDTFTVIEGTEKLVNRTDAINLLSNDSDDVDLSNKPLSVNTTPVEFPQMTSAFSLSDDGGFSYFYQGDPTRPAGEQLQDTFIYEVTDGVHTSTAQVMLNIVTVDDPPELVSDIPDQSWFAGIKKTYDFSVHFNDPEGADMTFSETTGQLPDSFDRDALRQGILVSTPAAEEVGEYSVVLAASDGNTGTSDAVVISILGNKPPVWDNIPRQSGTIGKTFSLDLNKYAEDPESQPLFFSVQGQPGFLQLKGSKLEGKPTTTGEWKITVSANDAFNPKTSQSFTLGVFNSPPTARQIPNQQAVVNNDFSLNAAQYFSDPEGQTLSYSVSGASFLSINSKSGKISGKPNSVGDFTVTVTANDGFDSSSSNFKLSVANPPPTLVNSIPDWEIQAGESVFINFSEFFTDPNNNLTFSASGLPAGLTMRDNGIVDGSVSQTTTSSHNVTITAKESNGPQKASDTFKLTVVYQNPPPVLNNAIPDASVKSGQGVSINVSSYFSDDNDPLTFSASGLPSGLSINSGGLISGSVSVSQTTAYNITVTAKEQNGSQQAQDTFKLTVTYQNPPPVLNQPIPDESVGSGENVSINVSGYFSDDNDALTFGASGLPSGLSINSGSGVISGSVSVTQTTSYNITVTAKEQNGSQQVQDTFKLTVTYANQPPVAQNIPNQQAITNIDFSFEAGSYFSDPENQGLSFSLSGADFLSINNSGKITGKPAGTGDYGVTVTASDGSASASSGFTLTVTNPPPELVGSIPNWEIDANESVSENFSGYFSDVNNNLSFTATGLPNGLSISNGGVISGTVSQTVSSNHNVTITAKEANGPQEAQGSFVLTVIYTAP